ncbi:MAG: homocysteine S-methyltransferase family protein [Pseudomonadota bacterium]
MSIKRKPLPLANGPVFLTDGGMETTFIFHEGLELPEFSSLVLIKSEDGRQAIAKYAKTYIDLARDAGLGLVIESTTWRAGPDWADKIGFPGLDNLAGANRDSIALLDEMRREAAKMDVNVIVSACIGPRGDGYDPGRIMTGEEAALYHDWQVRVLAETNADVITGLTMTNVPEAIGIATAAKLHDMPCVISFTLETDGRLPTGDSLEGAIVAVDAATGDAPAYYMINCAHPTHLIKSLDLPADIRERLRGIRANASKCSHAELDEMEELDVGNPHELGREMADIHAAHPHIRVLGGCCGTDDRHVREIAKALMF